MISRGGLSPQSTFLLALQSVPNLAIRERLEQQGNQMGESEKLSTALRKAAVLPPEYGDIVQTGEITGDVPRALESVHKATDADYRAKDSTAVTRSSFILYGLLGVVIMILSGWLLTKYYGGLIHTILGD
jgi:type II secretory pathway component PulF